MCEKRRFESKDRLSAWFTSSLIYSFIRYIYMVRHTDKTETDDERNRSSSRQAKKRARRLCRSVDMHVWCRCQSTFWNQTEELESL
jgi:hypothetical protein